ncbi:flagellar biosynthesis protein FlhF [Thalassotalea hakodatensis]|uniref:flagellar biosynthesis protein FlhF n=1 Tax=Thalassotalea hakodatensis TaxID=3030492 RepID=UPI0025735045|nr:flagellar biosynthesis protein FlhF [Thalassotalea hakodatensis]
MKIRRFVAKDMRTALEQIKLELGAEAVIMSNKKIPEGVELMAAVDYSQQTTPSAQPSEHVAREISQDVVSIGQQPQNTNEAASNVQSSTDEAQPPADSLAALLQRQQNTPKSKATPIQTSTAHQQQHALDIEQQLKNFTDRLEQGAHQAPTDKQHAFQSTPEALSTETPNNAHQSEQASMTESHHQTRDNTPQQNREIEAMRREMSSIRQLLEHQISGLMWQDMAQKNPAKALLVDRLMAMGITENVADQIASYLPNVENEEDSWLQAKQLLASQLYTTNNEIIHRGGVVSLVGPTGVGKTTTVAKLAARFAQIHGADKVAMISTDSYRIAGFEQLTTYGRIIGCQVKLAKDGAALDTLLQQFSDKKLVLIDTAGMGQRDMRLNDHLTTLIANSRVRIRNYLVLSANTQQRVMQENVERFKKVPLAGCIYTKLDESLSVGEIIATSIQNGLAIGYLTDGQRVPEDIKVANAEKLVTLADRLATKLNGHNSWRPTSASMAVGM